MNALKTTALAALALPLASCAALQDEPPVDLAAACQTYTSALRVATVLKADGALPDGAIEAIDIANAAVDPLCGADEPPANLAQALALVLSATDDILLAISEE